MGPEDWTARYTEMIASDMFNEGFKAKHGIDPDEAWRPISGRKVSAQPPADADAIRSSLPDWVCVKPDVLVRELWPDTE